jgi:hypothetical protein
MQRSGTFVRCAIALACLVVLAQFHVREIVASSIQYDDAHNANVAKDVAFGMGYSTSYHEIVPFNPEATTGPAMLLPAAAFVWLFGNRYWVPTFAVVVCLWTALGLVLFLLRRYLDPRAWWIATALIAFGLAVYDADEFGLLGDVPGALLAIASVLVLCRQSAGDRAWWAGLLLGVAIQVKLLVLLVAPAALAYMFVAPSPNRRRDVVLFCAGAILPSALWELWQLVSTGSLHEWAVLNARQFAFIRTWSGVNIVQTIDIAAAVRRQLSLHVSSLLEDFHGWPSLVVFPAALAFGLSVMLRSRRAEAPQRAASLILVAAGFVHLLWWFALDTDGWYRHLLPAVVYVLVAAAIVTAANTTASPRLGVVGLVLLLASGIPQLSNLSYVFRPFSREPRLSALLATRDAMIVLQKNHDFVFVGYGWWVPRDLEYVLPAVGNFKDVLRLRKADLAGKTIVLVRNEFFNREHSPYTSAFQQACDRDTLYTREPFVISVCPSLPGDLR